MVLEAWKKAHITPPFKRGEEEEQQGHLHLDPWEGDGATIPGNHF